MFKNPITDDSLKETIERMKKRLAEQDEKHSKQVKELKNKEGLIAKLKQELREVMENM
jgi:arsenate reductase-like glutaredoxin family protein